MSQVLDVRTVVVSPTLPPLQGVQLPDGQVGATLRSLCIFLQLNFLSQQRRIARSRHLRNALTTATVATKGGPQEMAVLMAWVIPHWALGIQTDRLDAAKRARVLIIQTQAVEALYRAFSGAASNVVPQTEEVIEPEIVSTSGLNTPLEARLVALEKMVHKQAGEIAALNSQARANERLLAAVIERLLWLQTHVMQRDSQQEEKPQPRRRRRPRRKR
jgi:uncharacterized coiled-coil protein SlyX